MGGNVSDGSRLEILTLEPHAAPATFADDVRDGLGGAAKTLPPKYFYDDLGSRLFEAICALPEYYLTRAEREILERYAGEIVARVAGPVELVEFGSGSAEKTRLLVAALLERQTEVHYVPVDISVGALEASAHAMLDRFPGVRITAFASDYEGALGRLREHGPAARLALFLGSNVGNLDDAQANAFLSGVRAALRPDDALLLGADLKKSAAVLEAAYDDPLGVTAAFNLNMLVRINRELGADFDVRRFAHRARYDERDGVVRMHLVSLEAQTVEIRALGMRVAFAEGETIHTEDSRKYDVDDLSRMARGAGFRRAETWFDAERRFSSSLFVAEG
jgi:dimethylhistidine N-methyltransferase